MHFHAESSVINKMDNCRLHYTNTFTSADCAGHYENYFWVFREPLLGIRGGMYSGIILHKITGFYFLNREKKTSSRVWDENKKKSQ